VGLLLLLARLRPRTAGLATGSAAGIAVGGGSVLLAVCATRFGDLGALLTSAAPYATVAVGLLGLLLSSAAFQTGSLGAPLAALSVVEPVVAVVLAAAVLHERLPTAPGPVAAALAGGALAVAGVLVLARAQEVASAGDVLAAEPPEGDGHQHHGVAGRADHARRQV
jgi:hypothetical protein